MRKRFPAANALSAVLALILVLALISISQSPNGGLAFVSAQAVATPTVATQPANPLPERRNLGLFFDKLRAGKTISVAYVGGSVTAGLETKTPYRAHVTNWLKQQYPQAKISELNSSIAGTGALYGALRIRRDVIAYKPDLVVLDYALADSNDLPESEEAFKKALEGMFRQLLIVPQPPEVLLVYAAAPQSNQRIEWAESLATHYMIPSVNLQEAVQKQIKAGEFNVAALGKDGTQANDEAHKIYGKLITGFLAAQAQLPATPLVRNLVNPLVSDEMNYGEFKAIAEIKHGALWKTEASNDRALPASLLVSDKPGAEIEIFFDGTVLGLTFQAGPNGGTIECLIDGKPAAAPLHKVDCYAPSPRLQTRIIPGGLMQGEHKLTIRVSAEKNGKSSGNAVKLGSMLVGGQRPERL